MDLFSSQTKRPFINFTILLVLLFSCSSFPSTAFGRHYWRSNTALRRSFMNNETVFNLTSAFGPLSIKAYDAYDPKGNITIKWDVISWTPDGYVANVTIYNYQKYRTIQAPGWRLGWTWGGNEVIWSMLGAQTTEQGDCSSFKGNIPHSCIKNPKVVDLLPGTPYTQQVANCCRGGVMGSWGENQAKAVSSFQISVGGAGTTNRTVNTPRTATLEAPGRGYKCGPSTITKPSRFITPDGITRARMTWRTTCTYSRYGKPEIPTCCVSLSSYNSKTTKCPTCSCAQITNFRQGNESSGTSVKSTRHMCPVHIHWDVKQNYKDYWRTKIKITNYNNRLNYTDWNLVVQDRSFSNLTQILGFNYKPLTYHGSFNGSTMLWGIKSFNDVIPEAGPYGNVHSQILFRKDERTSSSPNKGWAFPEMVYFNGNKCVMPILD